MKSDEEVCRRPPFPEVTRNWSDSRLAYQCDQPARAPPVALPNFEYTAESMRKLTEEQIELFRACGDEVVKEEQCTFQSVVLPLAHAKTRFSTNTQPALFLKNVSSTETVRKAAVECTQRIDVGL